MAIESAGLAQGLAYRLPWDQMINQERQNYIMKQQKQLLAEQKAKLFADDADYNNVANDFDNPRIKDYALKKISELGSFVKENPGWETDPGARMVYNRIKRDLKDNPELNRGLLSEANYKSMMNYVHDPKNADVVNSIGIDNIMAPWNEYRKNGNQRGKAGLDSSGVQPFIFSPPEDLLDLTSVFQDYGSKMTQTDVKSDGQYWRLATSPKDIRDAADAILSNPVYKRGIEKAYDQNGKGKYEDARQMVIDGLSAWKKSDQVHRIDTAGEAYKRARLKALSEADVNTVNVLQEAANAAKDLYDKRLSNYVPFNGNAIAYIHGAKNGMLDASDAVLPFDLVGQHSPNIGVVKATPKEKIVYKGKNINGDDMYAAPYQVTMNRDQIMQKLGISEDKMKEIDEGLDYQPSPGKKAPAYSDLSGSVVKEPAYDSKGQPITDKDGNPVYNYSFEVEKPIGINKWNSAAANAEYNVPTKNRSIDVDSDDSESDETPEVYKDSKYKLVKGKWVLK